MNYLQAFCLDKFIPAVVHLSERGWRLLAGGETSNMDWLHKMAGG